MSIKPVSSSFSTGNKQSQISELAKQIVTSIDTLRSQLNEVYQSGEDDKKSQIEALVSNYLSTNDNVSSSTQLQQLSNLLPQIMQQDNYAASIDRQLFSAQAGALKLNNVRPAGNPPFSEPFITDDTRHLFTNLTPHVQGATYA